MTVNVPIVNAGLPYVQGLQLSWVSNSTVSLAAGQARNSSNVNDIILDDAVTISGLSVGPNGCDQAVLANSSMYAVYVIGNSNYNFVSEDFVTPGVPAPNMTAGLLSLASNAQPYLPYGYDMYRRVGWLLTDVSGNILKFWQYGSDERRDYYYDVGIAVTTANVTTFTAVSLAAGVPPLATRANLLLTYTAASAANSVQFLPFGSSASNGIVDFGSGVAAAQKGNVLVPTKLNAGAATVLYKMVASDAMTTLIVGYEDYL